MEIAVIGAGRMSSLLGSYWARNGHNIRVGSREPARAAALAAEIGHGARSGGYADAMRDADVMLLAVTPDVVENIARDNSAAPIPLGGAITRSPTCRRLPSGSPRLHPGHGLQRRS